MKNYIKVALPYILIVLVVVLIRTFLITPIKVIGPSMENTLKSGDVMILNKIAKIDRYDIVVIDSPKANEILIKRVIGMPGEIIKIEDNVIYINGKRLGETYGKNATSDYPETKIGYDEYFVLGDNRAVSADSRLFGPFNVKDIKGTTRLTIFPFNHFGFKK